ncbi:MAG: ABC transporter permease [Planctomycetota bacterium]|nr:MAG: ABC transporter permease [Planctomycetota bacterium]
MRTADVVQLAWTGLRQHKLRSALTALGVTVGVFAFTTIVAMGAGLEAAVVEQLTDGESQTRLIVRPGFGKREARDAKIVGVKDPAKIDRLRKSIAKRRRGGPAQRMRKLLTPDVLAWLDLQPHVRRVRPLVIDRFTAQLDEEHVLEGAIGYGVERDAALWNHRVILGEPFAAGRRGVWIHEYTLYRWGLRSDAEQRTVLGRTLVLRRPRGSNSFDSLLAAARARGIELPVDEQRARALYAAFAGRAGAQREEGAAPLRVELPILGVVRERVEADGFEVWEDSFSMQADLFLPQELAEELFAQVPSNLAQGYTVATVELESPEFVAPLEKSLREEGYRTVSIGTILERVERVMATVTAMVSGLTTIALVVAVLGIVNTMIMNVSERTKEIGILKALGATDGDVRRLFLVESAMIGACGGVAGVLLALAASVVGDEWTQRAIKAATEYSFDRSVFRFHPLLVAGALGAALLLSVLAALGPAGRASRVDPTLALREE